MALKTGEAVNLKAQSLNYLGLLVPIRRKPGNFRDLNQSPGGPVDQAGPKKWGVTRATGVSARVVLAMVGVTARLYRLVLPECGRSAQACAQRMGAGLDPLGAALGHYRTGPVRPSPTRPRATPAPDSAPPSNGRRASPKLVRTTLLATVAAAPVALAVRAFRGTASSPKTMGRVLVHLAMLSTASGAPTKHGARGDDHGEATVGVLPQPPRATIIGRCVGPPRWYYLPCGIAAAALSPSLFNLEHLLVIVDILPACGDFSCHATFWGAPLATGLRR